MFKMLGLMMGTEKEEKLWGGGKERRIYLNIMIIIIIISKSLPDWTKTEL